MTGQSHYHTHLDCRSFINCKSLVLHIARSIITYFNISLIFNPPHLVSSASYFSSLRMGRHGYFEVSAWCAARRRHGYLTTTVNSAPATRPLELRRLQNLLLRSFLRARETLRRGAPKRSSKCRTSRYCFWHKALLLFFRLL